MGVGEEQDRATVRGAFGPRIPAFRPLSNYGLLTLVLAAAVIVRHEPQGFFITVVASPGDK